MTPVRGLDRTRWFFVAFGIVLILVALPFWSSAWPAALDGTAVGLFSITIAVSLRRRD